jgi:hypoxanthine phosphoribosyltransferase
MALLKIKDLSFEQYISEAEIKKRVLQLGEEIADDYQGEPLVLLGVLNGSFIFLADLARGIKLETTFEFIKVSSYEGLESTGVVKTVLGLTQALKDKNVVIVEDIIDTGTSMKFLLEETSKQKPKKVSIATLLFKPTAFRYKFPLDYVGFEIPDKFVVGYGLDYDGLGRNFPDIYQLSTL